MIISVEMVYKEKYQTRTKSVLVFTSKLPYNIVMQIKVDFPNCWKMV